MSSGELEARSEGGRVSSTLVVQFLGAGTCTVQWDRYSLLCTLQKSVCRTVGEIWIAAYATNKQPNRTLECGAKHLSSDPFVCCQSNSAALLLASCGAMSYPQSHSCCAHIQFGQTQAAMAELVLHTQEAVVVASYTDQVCDG